MVNFEPIWEFNTASLRVALEVSPEEMDPADSFEFDDDIAFARSGDPAAWFCARVRVYDRAGRVLGDDHLGGCSYRSWADFYASHRNPDPANRNTLALKARNAAVCHYFPGMVTEALHMARATLSRFKRIPLRVQA